jgi:hypothetical protein
MRKTEEYNNLSEKKIKSATLKRGEIAVFRSAAIQRHPFMPEEVVIPTYQGVSPVDQIWDEELQEYVDIAAIKTVKPGGEPEFHEIAFTKIGAGHIILKGDSAGDREIYSFMFLSNFNGSNPDRNTDSPIMYTMIDEIKKSEVERKGRNFKREALNIAADLSADDVRVYSAALGRDDSRSLEVLRNELELLADRDPQGFLELVNNKQSTMKAIINRALLKGVLSFDNERSMFTWPNGEVILTVARATGQDAVDELIAFCISSAKGEKVYQTITAKSKK